MIETAVEHFYQARHTGGERGNYPAGDIVEATSKDWDQVMAVDGRGMLLTCESAIEGC